jgi:F-type H+-transporting ATPase subunit delta
MAGERISRRKLAAYMADRLASGAPANDVIMQAAAYLIETKQTHDVELLVRDIEEKLMAKGIVVADVTAASPLTDEAKSAIASLLEAKDLHVRETVDSSVLGGIRVAVPGKRYDATLRHKINLLKSLER